MSGNRNVRHLLKSGLAALPFGPRARVLASSLAACAVMTAILATLGGSSASPNAALPTACTPPGDIVVLDSGTNDATDGLGSHDIISTSVAFPFTGAADPDKLYFTIKVASLTALTPSSFYFTSFTLNGANEAAGAVRGVRMVVDAQGAATFESYVAGASNAGTVDGRFVVAGSNKPAEAGSNFNANGTITIIVKRTDIGIAPGGTLTKFNGAVAQTAAGVVTGIVDWMPTGTATTASTRANISFTVQSNQLCDPDPDPSPSPSPSPSPTATPSDAGKPRYMNYYSPWGDRAAEPSVGSNWGSEQSFSNSMFTIPNGGSSHFYGGFFTYMLKATWNDCSSPANPNFEKRPLLLAGSPRAFGDPILFTDNHTPGQHGRTFVSQLVGLTPAGSGTDYTDDDGATFKPSEGSGLPSHIDHQTIGGGPFKQNASPATPPHTYPNAIYYCSQNVSDAACSLSIDGGVTFGPAVPIFTVNDCAGLHGHLKVAPDGTVYVPNKACSFNGVPLLLGGNAAVIVSENNGITWSIRPVPDDKGGNSAGEWDSSVGVATNGTIYLGYQDVDNHARIAVSHDRGLTWNQSIDVGVPSASVTLDDPNVDSNGIENMVFPEVVAGDPNRAAFAFYGSDKSDAEGGDHSGGGNNNPTLFTGVWYQYIATTFDGGNTWITINSTPNDPIQRGSICHDSTCRNLLDFFDIQIDKRGRVLVAGQDGCIGGCVNGPPNSFTAQAFITRQSGGRGLFAAYDPVEPALAGAPKGTAVVNGAGTATNLSWPVPDNGGATITSYKIYRDDGSGFGLIATVSEPTYTDPASSVVGKHYRVTAVNSMGEGPYCNDFVSVPGPTETACVEPGITVTNDTNPDGTDADAGQNTPPEGSVNIRRMRIAEPFITAGQRKLIFTMQLAPSLLAAPPPNSQWIIVWNRIGGVAPDGSDRRYVAMVSNANGQLSFDYGNFGPALPIGGVPPANANAPTRLGAADSGSYNPQTGLVKIILDVSKAENIQPGQTLAALNIRTYLNRPDYPGFQRSQNNASDITADSSYTVVGNDVGCLANAAPLAVLSANPTSGNSPLTVNFDASNSTDSDPGDSITSYLFTYGDGTPEVEQSSPTVAHTYNCAMSVCDYVASLNVKDESGTLSANTAQVSIRVQGNGERTNYALSTNGASILASSSHGSGLYPASAVINGDRTGSTWGTSSGGWNDATRATYPDTLEINFSGPRFIDEINVVTLQNNWKNNPGEPTLTTSASGEGILDFNVEYWNGSAWVSLGSVTGNDKAWRQFMFTPVTTTKIRLVINNARNNFSRVVELEAVGPGGQ